MGWKSGWMWGAVGLLCAACARKLPEAEHAPTGLHMRPTWVSSVGVHADAMRVCLAPLEAPSYVAFVDALSDGVTGVSTVDAYGAVQHCAVRDGRVVRREPAPLSARDISRAGGALLSIGVVPPIVPSGIVLEEVLDDGRTLGWLYWPSSDDAESDELAVSGGEVAP
jgi:hypothetical protein